jgi:hypothetical protein
LSMRVRGMNVKIGIIMHYSEVGINIKKTSGNRSQWIRIDGISGFLNNLLWTARYQCCLWP